MNKDASMKESPQDVIALYHQIEWLKYENKQKDVITVMKMIVKCIYYIVLIFAVVHKE